MFEFTEDKKGIRPKWVGCIKRNWLRRVMLVLALPLTIAVVIFYNLCMFALVVLLSFVRLIAFGTIAVLLRPFTRAMWDVWHEPRKPMTVPDCNEPERINFQCTARYDIAVGKAPIVKGSES